MDGTDGQNKGGDTPPNTKESIEVVGADEELDALLDSALDDFDKPLPKPPPKPSTTESQCSSKPPQTNDGNSDLWSKEFKQFQDAMQTFFDEDPQLKKELDLLTKSANATAESSGTGEDFAVSLAETLKGLAEKAQSLTDPASEEDLSRLLGGLAIGEANNAEGEDRIPDLMPLMHNVMQNLLSKELLYPSLKDIVDKYPDWLAEKRTSLEQQQFEKYNRQYELMKKVCEEFENDCEDSEEGKKMRFERVLVLMQKMQDCGHPPKELVGEMGQDFRFDDIKLPGMQDQCSVM